MKRVLKKVGLGLLGVIVLGGAGVGIFACTKAAAFDAAMEKTWDVPVPKIERSTDPAVLARGKHLVESFTGCSDKDCHGSDLAGGNTIVMGPVATLTGPNITSGGLGAAYSDGELARLIKHGLKKDGRSVTFMVVQESMYFLPDADVVAVVSYIRTLPAVDKPNGPMKVGLLGKILDRKGDLALEVASRIDHTKNVEAKPAPTKEYGSYLAKGCTGCHGEKLSGGPIPGAPASLPTPLNITPDETGLKGWTQADFEKLLKTAERKNGKKLDPFMPVTSLGKMDETEVTALWAYLSSVPAVPSGNR